MQPCTPFLLHKLLTVLGEVAGSCSSNQKVQPLLPSPKELLLPWHCWRQGKDWVEALASLQSKTKQCQGNDPIVSRAGSHSSGILHFAFIRYFDVAHTEQQKEVPVYCQLSVWCGTTASSNNPTASPHFKLQSASHNRSWVAILPESRKTFSPRPVETDPSPSQK